MQKKNNLKRYLFGLKSLFFPTKEDRVIRKVNNVFQLEWEGQYLSPNEIKVNPLATQNRTGTQWNEMANLYAKHLNVQVLLRRVDSFKKTILQYTASIYYNLLLRLNI